MSERSVADTMMERFADAIAYAKRLEAENAELRQRIDEMIRDLGRNAANSDDPVRVVKSAYRERDELRRQVAELQAKLERAGGCCCDACLGDGKEGKLRGALEYWATRKLNGSDERELRLRAAMREPRT